MYLSQSLIDGLKILGFDKETIRKVSREKSLEEIFLSTLFMNYLVVLIVFLIGISLGSVQIAGRDLNMPVLFGLLMIYPFAFNVIVYVIYGLFGVVAELLNNHKKVKPLISVGFHTAIVYTILIYVIAMLATYDPIYSLGVFSLFAVYFLLTMFLAVTTIYDFSQGQALMVLFIPILLLFVVLFALMMVYPLPEIVGWFLA